MTFRCLLAATFMLMAVANCQFASAADADTGGSNGGGGNEMEPEFKAIALNIQQWIEHGGAASLNLKGVSTKALYKSKMLNELKNYHIEMVPFTVKHFGDIKTCVSKKVRGSKNWIRCNIPLFRDTYKNDIDGAYRLVHHEFAGLAGIEHNRKQDSDYKISDQIAKKLEYQQIKRLPIDGLDKYLPAQDLRTFSCGPTFVMQTFATDDERGDFAGRITANDFVSWLMLQKNSVLNQTLEKMQVLYPDIQLEVGDAVVMEGSGHVSNYKEIFLVPLTTSEKRYTGTTAYVRVVAHDLNLAPGETPPFAPKGNQTTSFKIDGVIDPLNPKNSVEIDEEMPAISDMTVKNCRDVKIKTSADQ